MRKRTLPVLCVVLLLGAMFAAEAEGAAWYRRAWAACAGAARRAAGATQNAVRVSARTVGNAAVAVKDFTVTEVRTIRTSARKSGTVEEFAPRSKRRAPNGRTTIYVNGVLTPFGSFRREAQSLADVLGRPVAGVYAGGATQGLASTAVLQIENLTRFGPATLLPEGRSLLRLLRQAEAAEREVDLVCHSRGAMVADAILRRVPWARDHVTVYAFGCTVWRAFPVRSYYKIVNRGDRLLKRRIVTEKNVVCGRSGGHPFADYVENLRTDNYDTDLPLTAAAEPDE